MAFKEFRTRAERRDETAAQQAKAGTTFIDEGCQLSGKLRFKEAVRIDGRIDGQIEGDNTVVVGETGRIHATLDAESVVIYGTVEGDISAKRKITLHKGAHVTAGTAICLHRTTWTARGLRVPTPILSYGCWVGQKKP